MEICIINLKQEIRNLKRLVKENSSEKVIVTSDLDVTYPKDFTVLLKIVAEHFSLSYANLKKNKRISRRYEEARHCFCYIAYNYIHEVFLDTIGLFLSGRDHSTVLNSCEKYINLTLIDKTYKSLTQQIIIDFNIYLNGKHKSVSIETQHFIEEERVLTAAS